MEAHFNYNIKFIMNVTDIDDKIIKRARLNPPAQPVPFQHSRRRKGDSLPLKGTQTLPQTQIQSCALPANAQHMPSSPIRCIGRTVRAGQDVCRCCERCWRP